MKDMFERLFPGTPLLYVGREESASPATGSHARHEREQKQIVTAALAGAPEAAAARARKAT
jgi:2-oxoglutarate dehydrogenase complex dehydrogenase (E1) component-like enzyme